MRPELQGLPQGWPHHIEKILELLEVHRPAVTVELGTWRGASAIALARLVRTWGGVVYCVDTWTGAVKGGKAGTVPGMPKMLLECATNLVAAGVGASVRFIPSRTDAAAEAWSLPIDFLYVDADHTEASVRDDLARWWPHLRVGGLIAGDDYDNPMYPGVVTAWDAFEREQGQPFERVATPNTNPPGMRLIYGVKKGTA
jgi:predicted O-methyltransferase YrrM